MKILFASDMSFNCFTESPSEEMVNSIFGKTAEEFSKVDFSLLNLETIFGEPENYTPLVKSGPNLISSYAHSVFFDALHPTALGLANNHARDYGDEALADTMKFLSDKGYMLVGAGENIDKAYEPIIFEKDGERVAIYAVVENEPGYAEDNHGGTAGYNITRVKNAIKASRERGEIPIIYFHGGNEYNPFPSPAKTDLYRLFVDLGAAAVIAMHTHCPQGTEYYNGAPIIYSMGNFYFPWSEREIESWYYGYMTTLEIKNGKVTYDIIPYTFDNEYHRVLKGEELKKFMAYMDYISAPLSDAKKIQEYFDAWCVKSGIYYLLPLVKYEDEMLEIGADAIKRFKNILNCEAHAEVIANAAKVIYDGNVENASKLIPELESLQNMDLLKS